MDNEHPGRSLVSETSGQTDSFLTAARLLRGGWLEEETTTRKPLSNGEERQQPPSTSDRIQVLHGAKLCLKDLRTRRVLVLSSRKTEERETGSETKTDEAKQTAEGPERQTQRQTVKVWTSGCRVTCRQSRRFKAPILPAIAEI